MEVLSWKLPSYITQFDVHYYGQIFAMEDCLFRSINHLDFVTFNDLDEYINPLQYVNISSTLRSIHKGKHYGHCFFLVSFNLTLVTRQRDFVDKTPRYCSIFDLWHYANSPQPSQTPNCTSGAVKQVVFCS